MPTLLITRFPYQSQLGGEEIHTVNLAKGLIKKGWKIILWTSCPILKEEFNKNHILHTIYYIPNFPKPPVSKFSLVTFTLLSPFLFLYFAVKYLQILRTTNYELQTIYMMSLGEKLLLTPIIKLYSLFPIPYSRIVWIEHARIGKWLTSNPWKIFYKLWSKFVKIICVSKQSAKYLSWAHNIIDIPNGINLEEFPPLSFPRRRESSKLRIGVIARLSEDKGIEYLIKAISNIKNCELLIIGEGPLSNSPMIRGARGVVCLGKISRSEIINFYKNIDIFVLPSSEHDPFGLVIAEAMASKAPTIVTNVCGITDYLKDFEDTRIIPAKNPKALENGINWYIENPDKKGRMIENAYKKCNEMFDVDKMVEKYKRIFNQ